MEAHVSRQVGEDPAEEREANIARAKPLSGEEGKREAQISHFSQLEG